jgi:hypothetical protein
VVVFRRLWTKIIAENGLHHPFGSLQMKNFVDASTNTWFSGSPQAISGHVFKEKTTCKPMKITTGSYHF